MQQAASQQTAEPERPPFPPQAAEDYLGKLQQGRLEGHDDIPFPVEFNALTSKMLTHPLNWHIETFMKTFTMLTAHAVDSSPELDNVRLELTRGTCKRQCICARKKNTP